MAVARLNMAYGTFEEHARLITTVRSQSEKLGLCAGVLLDLPGRKRHTGNTRDVFGEHIKFAKSQDVDFIALSFISSAEEVREVQELKKAMKTDIPVIAKIEKEGALKEASAVLELSEGLMVARGDLALEISIEKVPLAQKRLIREANRLGKPVITATEMLKSMVNSDTPTRAEATDVANAVLDGTDALMLSEETSLGSYPADAAGMMAKIALEAETGLSYEVLREGWEEVVPETDDAAARAACQIAHQLKAKAIVAFTAGGTTALRVSKYRPLQPIIAITPSSRVWRRLSLVWGVIPMIKTEPSDLETVFSLAGEAAKEVGVARKGDIIVITAGLPLAVSGGTNLVKIHRV